MTAVNQVKGEIQVSLQLEFAVNTNELEIMHNLLSKS